MTFFSRQRLFQALEDRAVSRAVQRVLASRSYYGFAGHPSVKMFEEALSVRLGGAPVAGTASGTDALILALKVLGIGPGDEVITPAFSFISTASCIAWVGAKPVFADIRPDDFSLAADEVERRITPRTKAIIVAHLFGHPASETERILEIARQHGVALIEDAAQSFGAAIRGGDALRSAGTLGDIGCLSFSSTKPLASVGNGGAMVFGKKDELYEAAIKMRFYGAASHYMDYPLVGVNSKMHEIQAAALLARLEFLDHWMEHRERLAACYEEGLREAGDLLLPGSAPHVKRTWYRYVPRAKKRDELFDHLVRAVPRVRPTKNYPVPLPYFSAFAPLGHRPGDFPNAERASREVISLPLTHDVTLKNAALVCGAIKDFFDFNSRM